MDSCHGFSVQHVHWPLRIQAEIKNDPEHTEARSIKWTISYSELRFLRLKTLQSPWGGKSFLPEGLQRDPNDLALHWRVIAKGNFKFQLPVRRNVLLQTLWDGRRRVTRVVSHIDVKRRTLYM